MAGSPDIRGRTYAAASALFLLTAGFAITRTARDALYFQADGLFALPKALLAVALFSIPQALVVLWLLRRLGPRVTRVVTLVAIIALLFAVYPFATPGAGRLMSAFFVAVPLVFSIAFSLVWLLGGELLEGAGPDTASTAFARIGASSILGGTAGALVARFAGSHWGPRFLLLLGGTVVLAALLVLLWIRVRFKPMEGHTGRRKAAPTEAAVGLRSGRAALLLGIAMSAAVAAILIDFQFYSYAAKNHASGTAMAVFFANVYAVLNGVSLLLQLLVTPRLQRRLGLGSSLLVLPSVVAAGALGALFSNAALFRSGLRVAEGGLKAGVHRSLWEQAYLSFTSSIRPKAKVLIDGLGARLAEGGVAVFLFFWLQSVADAGKGVAGIDGTKVVAALVGVTLLWIVLSVLLRVKLGPPTGRATSWQIPLPDS